MLRRILQFSMLGIGGFGLFLFFFKSKDINVEELMAGNTATTTHATEEVKVPVKTDIDPQPPLQNPPTIVKAIYSTGWSAGSTKKLDYLINLIDQTELNALVIDVKDYSGTISYATDIPAVKQYNATEIKINKPNALIKRLHDKNIYAIARITVFQDPALARARPDIALTSSSTKKQWQDQKGLMWMDPSSHEVWDYNIAIAQDALNRGFDEINFDYIRFPTDGKTHDIVYPFWNGISRKKTITQFLEYVRNALPNAKISADMFGLVTVATDDIGIGQYLETSVPYITALAPMVYPSHFANGTFGIADPASHPYEIIHQSMEMALRRLGIAQSKSSTTLATLRPWFQDFDLGADYSPEMVRDQIRAFDTVASKTPELTSGWFLWNPSNVYSKDALLP